MILMDLSMPGLQGKQLFLELQKINNVIPIIISTGHNIDKIENNFFLEICKKIPKC